MNTKNVSKEVVELLDKHLGIKNVQCCQAGLIMAAVECVAMTNYFKISEEKFLELKKIGAFILEKNTGIVNPVYSTDTKIQFLQAIRTAIFQQQTAEA